MESTLAGKQHVAAVEAYTRRCMKSRDGVASDEDPSTRGRTAVAGHRPARTCRSDEQFAASELMNGRESRPNNLVCSLRCCNLRDVSFISVKLSVIQLVFRMLEYSFPRLFVPWNIRSHDGTFVPGTVRSVAHTVHRCHILTRADVR